MKNPIIIIVKLKFELTDSSLKGIEKIGKRDFNCLNNVGDEKIESL